LGKRNENLSEEQYQYPLNSEFNHTEYLGFLETGFVNFILTSGKNLIILKGYRGTGKSELIRQISRFIIENRKHEACKYKDTCSQNIKHIILNFNEGEFSADKFSQDISIKIFNEIGAALGVLISSSKIKIIDDLIKYCVDEYVPYLFSIEDELVEKIKNWHELSEKKKYNHIFGWIRSRFENNYINNGLTALYRIINFYNSKFTRRHGCFLLIMDNIDKLNIEQQNNIIVIAKSISSEANIQVIMPVRLTTFDNIAGNASLNFVACTNIGFPPLELCLLRIKHYIEQREKFADYYGYKLIPQKYLEAFNERLGYIYDRLTNDDPKRKFDRLEKTFNALAGVSIRKCLRLFRRLFLNYTIEWTETKPFEDILLRSLYSYKYENGRMNVDKDNRIHNIYQDNQTKSLTLHNLRILNIIHYCEKNSISIKVKELFESLRLYNDINKDKYKMFRSTLWTQGKRIIILVDVGTNESEEKIDNAILQITKSGFGHIDYLCSNLQYLQNCFEIIDLNAKIINGNLTETLEYIEYLEGNRQTKELLNSSLKQIENKRYIDFAPNFVDYSEFSQRIHYIRILLRLLYMKDVVETIRYKKAYNKATENIKSISKISNLVTVPIIIGITNSVLNITQNMPISSDERELWKDLILLVYEWNKLLFPRSDYNRDLERLNNKVSSER